MHALLELAQFTHAVIVVAPVVVEYFPATQSTHVANP